MIATQVQTLQVTCVTTRFKSHDGGIASLGGPGWHAALRDVVLAIESGTHRFYTNSGGRIAWVRVLVGTSGKYVQTYADGVPTNNLLALNAC